MRLDHVYRACHRTEMEPLLRCRTVARLHVGLQRLQKKLDDWAGSSPASPPACTTRDRLKACVVRAV
jgi:hypothetical protein